MKIYIEANPLVYGYLQYRQYSPSDIKHISLMNFSYNILFQSEINEYITSDYAYREAYITIRKTYDLLCDMRFFAYIHRLGKRLDLIEAADDMFKIGPAAEKLSSKTGIHKADAIHIVIAASIKADHIATADAEFINILKAKTPIIKKILGYCPDILNIKC
jgi:predicted nucleic acid-binding protein